MVKLAIFASGNGSNALSILNFFEHHKTVKISLIVCSKKGAGVIEIANEKKVNCVVLEKHEFESASILNLLKSFDISMIVLAGFLLKISPVLVDLYPHKIINLHPALLPKYGGKGMYGKHVHQAVIDNHENESGISIHYVNENYDEGDIIFQEKVKLDSHETAATLSKKIQKLEHHYYPLAIQNLIIKK